MKYHFQFFGVGLALFNVAFNVYGASWLLRRLKPAPRARLFLVEGALLLSAFFAGARVVTTGHAGIFWDALLWLSYFGFGASFIIAWVLLVCDLGLAVLKALGAGWAVRRGAALAALAAALGLVCLAAWHGSENPPVKRVEIAIKGLPKALDGFTIVQISDIHLGRLIKAGRLAKIAGTINALKPDLVVLTGDFSESREPMPEGTCEILKGMYARYGKDAVLGNHDMFTGGSGETAFFESCGVKVLRGQAYEPVPGLVVAGVDDLHQRNMAALGKLAVSLDRSKPLIFLSHQPQGFDEITASGNGLVLCGHTHAGQIFPFGPLERHLFKYFYGLYKENGFSIYITSGAGTWGPPLRLFADPELPLFVLHAQN